MFYKNGYVIDQALSTRLATLTHDLKAAILVKCKPCILYWKSRLKICNFQILEDLCTNNLSIGTDLAR